MPNIYDEFKADLGEIITEGGRPVTYLRQTGETANLVAMVSNPNSAENLAAGGFVVNTGFEFKFLYSGSFFATLPAKTGDLIAYAGENWRIIAVDPVSASTLWIVCRTQSEDA